VASNVDAIAERRLELRSEHKTVDVIVKLGRPVRDASRDCWMCEYELRFGDITKNMAMYGIDALQALQLSIATLDVELDHGAKKHGGVLWHLDEPFTSILENSGLQVRAS